jgi:hypothetical protein
LTAWSPTENTTVRAPATVKSAAIGAHTKLCSFTEGIEEWYLYPVALHVILLTFGSAHADIPIRRSSLQFATLALAATAFVLVPFRDELYARRQAPLVEAARLLKDRFAGDGSAVFAMGDRAGAVGELLPNRLIPPLGIFAVILVRCYADESGPTVSFSNVSVR